MTGLKISFSHNHWARKATHWRGENHPAYQHVLSYVWEKFRGELEACETILDVGCGNGNFILMAAGRCSDMRVVGIDSCEALVRMGRIKGNDVAVAKADALPFRNSSFDVVIGMSLLHHVSNVEEVVKEMRRVARQTVLISEPNLYSPLQWLSSLRPHEWSAFRCSPARLIRVFRSEFQTVKVNYGGIVAENLTPSWLVPPLRVLEPFVDRYVAKPLALGIYLAGHKDD